MFIDEANDDFDSNKLHELVVEYLVFSGYKEAAEMLVADAELPTPSPPSIETTKNSDTVGQRNAIRAAIISGDLPTAFKLINELVPDLLSTNPKLNFNLQRQQLVELIRNKEVEKVLEFAQTNLTDKCSEISAELFAKLEQTYALLAFDNPENSPFGYLMSLNQRNMLAFEVNQSILTSLHKPSVSRLEQLFRLMVWNQYQLKTKGEGRSITRETTEDISKTLFGKEDESMNELL